MIIKLRQILWWHLSWTRTILFYYWMHTCPLNYIRTVTYQNQQRRTPRLHPVEIYIPSRHPTSEWRENRLYFSHNVANLISMSVWRRFTVVFSTSKYIGLTLYPRRFTVNVLCAVTLEQIRGASWSRGCYFPSMLCENASFGAFIWMLPSFNNNWSLHISHEIGK